MIDRYTWSGGSEAMLRFGPDHGPVVVAALPLFEEANRTRAFVVAILRRLAHLGIASALPDIPGQGESLAPLETLAIVQMQDAFREAVAVFEVRRRRCYALGVRSGALLDTHSLLDGRWHLAPQEGPELLRELARIKGVKTGDRDSGTDRWWLSDFANRSEPDPPVEIAGNLLSAGLLTELTAKSCFHRNDADLPLRVARFEGDPKPADVHFSGSPLWRRIEPDNDLTLAALLAEDIAAWVRACEG